MKRAAVVLSLVLLTAAGVYAFAIEPTWLRVSVLSRSASSLTKPLRVVLIADLHSDRFGAYEAMVVDRVAQHEPDLVLVAGDLVTPAGITDGANEFLSRLQAPLGVYWVPGNHEHWALRGEPSRFLEGGRALVNEMVSVRDDVWLVGLDDRLAGVPDPSILDDLPEHGVRLAMLHSPMGIEDLAGRVDFAFAGHSHGGQIRLPFIGPLALPPETGPYDAGWFDVSGTALFVTVGLGTSVFPIRFGCRPEIVVIDLMPG
ncbi:MAG: metallophosphoesterase [Myxococcota bacterium]